MEKRDLASCGLFVTFWGVANGFETWFKSSLYTACRHLPALTHGEMVINCAPFLRTTLLWGVFTLALLVAGTWALVRAFSMDRAFRLNQERAKGLPVPPTAT